MFLVNNAAVLCGEWWETCPMDAFYDTMEANYFGCVRTTRAVVPHMKERRSGRIIQIASILGFHGKYFELNYWNTYVHARRQDNCRSGECGVGTVGSCQSDTSPIIIGDELFIVNCYHKKLIIKHLQ